jgi:MtN3 and saliva related transmembrane protein
MMLGAQGAGVALWIVYGFAIESVPVIISNSVTLTMCMMLLGFNLRRS